MGRRGHNKTSGQGKRKGKKGAGGKNLQAVQKQTKLKGKPSKVASSLLAAQLPPPETTIPEYSQLNGRQSGPPGFENPSNLAPLILGSAPEPFSATSYNSALLHPGSAPEPFNAASFNSAPHTSGPGSAPDPFNLASSKPTPALDPFNLTSYNPAPFNPASFNPAPELFSWTSLLASIKQLPRTDSGGPQAHMLSSNLEPAQPSLPTLQGQNMTAWEKSLEAPASSELPAFAAATESARTMMASRSVAEAPPEFRNRKPKHPVIPAWLRQSHNAVTTPELESGLALLMRKNMEASTVSLLEKELSIFSALMYKNKSQHRRTMSFRRLYEVRRHIKTLEDLRLPHLMSEFNDLLVQQPANKHSGRVQVPLGETGVFVLHRLYAACRLSQAAVAAIRKAASQISAHLARLHFLKLHLVTLAVLSRMQVLVCTTLMDAISTYNSLVDLVCVLPFRMQLPHLSGEGLPQLLCCSWQGTLPLLESVSFEQGEGIPGQAAAYRARHAEDEELMESTPVSAEEALQEAARISAEAAIQIADDSWDPQAATAQTVAPPPWTPNAQQQGLQPDFRASSIPELPSDLDGELEDRETLSIQQTQEGLFGSAVHQDRDKARSLHMGSDLIPLPKAFMPIGRKGGSPETPKPFKVRRGRTKKKEKNRQAEVGDLEIKTRAPILPQYEPTERQKRQMQVKAADDGDSSGPLSIPHTGTVHATEKPKSEEGIAQDKGKGTLLTKAAIGEQLSLADLLQQSMADMGVGPAVESGAEKQQNLTSGAKPPINVQNSAHLEMLGKLGQGDAAAAVPSQRAKKKKARQAREDQEANISRLNPFFTALKATSTQSRPAEPSSRPQDAKNPSHTNPFASEKPGLPTGTIVPPPVMSRPPPTAGAPLLAARLLERPAPLPKRLKVQSSNTNGLAEAETVGHVGSSRLKPSHSTVQTPITVPGLLPHPPQPLNVGPSGGGPASGGMAVVGEGGWLGDPFGPLPELTFSKSQTHAQTADVGLNSDASGALCTIMQNAANPTSTAVGPAPTAAEAAPAGEEFIGTAATGSHQMSRLHLDSLQGGKRKKGGKRNRGMRRSGPKAPAAPEAPSHGKNTWEDMLKP